MRRLLEKFGEDRPVFHGRLSRGLRRTRFFQVFACRTGFLCLELTYQKRGDFDPLAFFRWMAAIWFGPLAIIAQVIMARKSVRHEAALDLSSAMLGNEEVVELARERKRSFVARYDDMQSAHIEPPGEFERFLYGNHYQGTVTFREKTVGKVTIHIYDRQCMDTAIDAFSERLSDIAEIRAEFDLRQRRFIAKR